MSISLHELTGKTVAIYEATESDIIAEAASRLGSTSSALSILEDCLFYVRMYKDASQEGRERRETLIEDAETIIQLIRNGEFKG